MGKSSPSSCWKIIACGSDSAVEDDIGPEEAKGPNKSGWRFRKKPARQRVLSDSAITANQASGNTVVSEKVVSVEQQDEKPQPEQQDQKPQPMQQDEKPQPPPQVEPKLPTSLQSRMLETVESPKSSSAMKSEADETTDDQPQLSSSMETNVLKTVIDPSTEPPAPGEQEAYETVAAPTTELQASAEPTILDPVASQLSSSMETNVSNTVIDPSTKSPASVEQEAYETVVAPTTELQASAEPKILDAVACSDTVDESSAVAIQSGVRGYLAQRELLKLKSVIKLQAAIRGHQVRRQAVDTLYCFKGIVKVQSIVRGRQSNLLGEVSSNKLVKTQTSMEKLLSNAFARQLLESTPKSKSTTTKCDPMSPNSTWNWLERWMAASSSGLPELQKSKISAEETSKSLDQEYSETYVGNLPTDISKSLNSEVSSKEAPSSVLRSDSSFKDAPSSFLRPDSSFNDAPSSFLRSESSFKDAPSSFLTSEPSFKDAPSSFLRPESSFKDASSLLNSEGILKEDPILLNEKNSSSNTETVDDPKSADLMATREVMHDPSDNHDQTNQSFMERLDNVATHKEQSNQPDSSSSTESCSFSHKTSVGTEEPKISAKLSTSASEQSDADGKRLAFGSRKASNRSFIAAQSKFEELSSAANPVRSLSSPRVDSDTDSHADADTASSAAMGNVTKGKDPNAVEVGGPDDLRIPIGGSECGTELSVTSTLDSPDRSEAGIGETDLELKFMAGKSGDVISKEQTFEFETNDNHGPYKASDPSPSVSEQKRVDVCETNVESAEPVIAMVPALQIEESNQVSPCEQANDVYISSIASLDPPALVEKPEISSSDMDRMDTTGSSAEHSAHRDNQLPKVISNSQAAVVELQGTPSSEVSVKAKKTKTDKRGSHSHPRRSSVAASKKSPSHNATHDSSARSDSVDSSAKDPKGNGKRKNSFGSTKFDNNVDQEPRDSTSSIKTLPSYMQATKSARAKANSPKASPDVQDNKDAYAKKRHSLPAATGRHGSPRVERSSSQAAQPTKSNGNTPTSQERRWVR